MIYLASSSPRRQELLRQIGVAFEQLRVDVDERVQAGESPRDYVTRLAREKAAAGLAVRAGELPVLGADTTVVLNGRILGKPADREQGLAMLEALSAHTHQVLSGVCLADGERAEVAVSASEVRFRELTRAEIERYWGGGEPVDKAGAYAIQGRGAEFVAHLSGSYSGVMGLPLFETAALLRAFGIDW